jgi:hypothetical protein
MLNKVKASLCSVCAVPAELEEASVVSSHLRTLAVSDGLSLGTSTTGSIELL